jgi:hypothetical protein
LDRVSILRGRIFERKDETPLVAQSIMSEEFQYVLTDYFLEAVDPGRSVVLAKMPDDPEKYSNLCEELRTVTSIDTASPSRSGCIVLGFDVLGERAFEGSGFSVGSKPLLWNGSGLDEERLKTNTLDIMSCLDERGKANLIEVLKAPRAAATLREPNARDRVRPVRGVIAAWDDVESDVSV